MSSSTGGFGNGKRDVRVIGLKWRDVRILDKDCNIRIPGQARFNNLTTEDMIVGESLQVCGNLVSNQDKLVLDYPTLVQGNTFSASDEFTEIETFGANANVEVIVTPQNIVGYQADSLTIATPPCAGRVRISNNETGEMTFTTVRDPPSFDIFQYRYRDSCGIPHLSTKLMCQQIVTFPPFLNNSCIEYGSNGQPNSTVYDLNADIMIGSDPVDWTTLVIKSLSVYIEDFQSDTYNCENAPSVPWDTVNTNFLTNLTQTGLTTWTATGVGLNAGTTVTISVSHNNAGLLTFQWTADGPLEQVDVFFRAMVTVMDENGRRSNCATVINIPSIF